MNYYGYMDAHKSAVTAPRRRRPHPAPFLKQQEVGQGHLASRAGKVQLDNGDWAVLPV
jgi:hypothetical protein